MNFLNFPFFLIPRSKLNPPLFLISFLSQRNHFVSSHVMMELLTTSDTTSSSYWLTWRVLICSVIVFTPVAVSLIIICKYEGLKQVKHDGKESQEGLSCDELYDDDVWKPCLQEIHPFWLLGYRVIAFCLALATIVSKTIASGAHIFYYYTQWTFTLVTIYFGIGMFLSIYGCYQHYKMSSCGFNVQHVEIDAELGYYTPLTNRKDKNVLRKALNLQERCNVSQAAGISSYLFQVIFQMNAGAVMLTDLIYWCLIFPFLTIEDYTLNFMTVNLHTLNAILLLGDTTLNSLRFPWFRISYFILWTGAFVIFHWILHACVSIWWPYPFLDLSSPNAPLWYGLLAIMHIPCYGIFALIVNTKHYLLSKWFPESYLLKR
ncbi:tRNA (adenine-N(1)-)-methyltransferase catalytic subunit TRMT61A [Hibiscus syriacus]|uniref:tRNA (Adenine-N(1)-)-methyltransferase catalytic subunit TRMT61A n=2 Tax=Hibiscus syriacus TaxID=106335 RepID=A0A6A2ZW55_HIBSY|nr:tRNA (adenine-N(1)-)-methyltransferase catalytic subunit TRMT61A [Hibiscus syriacus]